MQLQNVGTSELLISDILVGGYPVEFNPGEIVTLYDEDIARSAQITALVQADILVIVGKAEPNTLIGTTLVNQLAFPNGVTIAVYGDTIVFRNSDNTKSLAAVLTPGGY